MEIIFLLTGVVLGFVTGWLFFRLRSASPGNVTGLEKLQAELVAIDKEKSVLEERARILKEEKESLLREIESEKRSSYHELSTERERAAKELVAEREQHNIILNTERERVTVLNARLAQMEAERNSFQEKLATQKAELEELQKKFTTEFENIANKLLEEKSKKFTEQNKVNLDVILEPLKEKIKAFEEKVERTYKEESAERITLKAEIKSLVEMNKQISDEANNLAKALKGDNRKQGNWGEVILEKILERSGLEKDSEYRTQVVTVNSEGSTVKPDVVIYLPDEKNIIIDSKVSLVAYEAYVNSDTEEEREKYKKEHLLSIRNHIKQLSDKNYQSSATFNTPDFVLLFVPIESSFSVAIQADQELFNYAWERKIVIVSPSTLLATLRTIASVWKQEKQTRNAMEIAKESGRLYDKFVGFVEDMEKLGKQIETVQNTYEDASKKLYTGTGNLVSRVNKISKLGAKNNKTLPQKYLEAAQEEKLIEDEEI